MFIATVCLVISIVIWTAWFLGQKSTRSGVRLPPGPFPFPIIGNLLQLGHNPHQSLSQLSKTYGPLMSVKVGSINIVVVSSPEMAREMLTKHDQAISGRFIPSAFEAWDHHKFSLVSLPVGSEWRKFRKICKEQLFSTHKLEANQGLRQDKLHQLYQYVKDCCIRGQAVNIEEVIFTTTLNLMSATLFSLDLGELGSESIRELKGAVEAVGEVVETPNLADFFPVLKAIDPQGLKRRGKRALGKLLAILEDVIQQRLLPTSSSAGSPRKKDILESLLDLQSRKIYDLSTDEIKHLLLDLLLGGSELLSTIVESAMKELLLNPTKTEILKDELRTRIGKDKQVNESDMPRLPYLQAVIKEVFRYHPPGPLLLPRKVEDDIQVEGFMIPKGTQIFFNVWSMGRDSSNWSNSNSFEPERFLNSNIDFGGQHFQLIPFGSGRRLCPGIPLSDRLIHLMVAFLVHNFDWNLEPGQEINVSDKFGHSRRNRIPLKVIPSMHKAS